MSAGVVMPGAVLLLLITALAALARIRPMLADTTLHASWWWTLTSVCSVCLVELSVAWASTGDSGNSPPAWAVAARFAAAVSTFCPLMSVCGAKRPQDRAWPLIVGTLWVVLIVPAAELLLLRRGTQLEVQGLRAWFLVLLLFVGWINHALTRHGLAATFVALAQIGLLAEHWPLVGRPISPAERVGAIGLGVVALIVASRWRPAQTHRHPLDRVWLDFRDWFGLLWALRVAERVNAASAQAGWKVTLGWTGFHAPPLDKLAPDDRAAFEQTVWNLCQRFVSRGWFERRRGT